MKSAIKEIQDLLENALGNVVPVKETIQVSKPSPKIQADYITPVALTIYNKHKKDGCFGHASPKALADAIHSHIPPSPIIDRVEVAKNGFINIFLNLGHLSSTISQICRLNGLSVDLGSPPERVLVDFSSPNIAKDCLLYTSPSPRDS